MSIHVEEAWILDIKCFFENDDDDLDKPPSIHNVPKTLKSIKPEAYTPHLIAVGPYHHWREDLYEMERYKLITAKRVQSFFKTLKFQDLVDKLGDVEPKIRACYHKYLTIDQETLAWMMAIDGLFLLQFLQSFVSRDASVLACSARMSFLVNSNERNLIGYDSILKDIIMLENQIPIFVLKKILKIQCPNRDLGLDLLPKMFLGVCKEITPLKLKEDYPVHKIMKHRAHLLDLLYHFINPRCEKFQDDPIKEIEFKEDEAENNYNKSKQRCLFISHDTNQSSRVFHNLWNKVKSFGLLQKLKTGPLKGVISLVENLASQISPHIVKENPPSNGGSSSGENEEKKALRVEEIMIPSVTHLVNSRVEFKPTKGDIYSIKFDKKTMTFYLPTIKLDVNSEVVIRNLVAYEASAISGPLVVARYTELMNGIIDSAQDVKILVEKKIIESELSYEDVANMWNGMSKCVRLTRVDFMDKAIKDVNAYYYSMGKVKLYRMMKAYVYGSWRMLVILASLLVIGLMFLQSLCSVYDCPRLLHIGSAKNE